MFAIYFIPTIMVYLDKLCKNKNAALATFSFLQFCVIKDGVIFHAKERLFFTKLSSKHVLSVHANILIDACLLLSPKEVVAAQLPTLAFPCRRMEGQGANRTEQYQEIYFAENGNKIFFNSDIVVTLTEISKWK